MCNGTCRVSLWKVDMKECEQDIHCQPQRPTRTYDTCKNMDLMRNAGVRMPKYPASPLFTNFVAA
eukprot:6257222-Alexandrium_andersonii.AAC.1